jgi:hypothetical protein
LTLFQLLFVHFVASTINIPTRHVVKTRSSLKKCNEKEPNMSHMIVIVARVLRCSPGKNDLDSIIMSSLRI